MISSKWHMEKHRTNRISWLRAAVLGANDGIVSTVKQNRVEAVKKKQLWLTPKLLE